MDKLQLDGFIGPTMKHLEKAGWTFPKDAHAKALSATLSIKAKTPLEAVLGIQKAIEDQGVKPKGWK